MSRGTGNGNVLLGKWVSKMNHMNYKDILKVLEREHLWHTFDELYYLVQCDCSWTNFALQLEHLVEQGDMEYTLSRGMDVGCYRIKGNT